MYMVRYKQMIGKVYNDKHANWNILAGVLGSELKSFVIPDAAALLEFLEVFENHGVTGLIVLQTSASQVSQLLHYRSFYKNSMLQFRW